MKQAKTVKEHKHKSIGGIFTFICVMIVILTLADTVLKLYFPAWHIPFWICISAIGLLVGFKYIQYKRS